MALPHSRHRELAAYTQIFYESDVNLAIFSFQTSLPLTFFLWHSCFRWETMAFSAPPGKAVVSPPDRACCLAQGCGAGFSALQLEIIFVRCFSGKARCMQIVVHLECTLGIFIWVSGSWETCLCAYF